MKPLTEGMWLSRTDSARLSSMTPDQREAFLEQIVVMLRARGRTIGKGSGHTPRTFYLGRGRA